MGSLRELRSESKSVHLVYSNSGLAEMYAYDELKDVCNASLESVYNIESKTDFKNMMELVNIESYLSDKWLFIVDYSKLRGSCKTYKGVFSATTSCFLVKVKNYKEYKEFKELVSTCNDLYLSIMRKNDTMFLLQNYGLSQKIIDFVATSYARDPEKIFKLKEQLSLGIEVESQKDIVKLLGVSSGSINSFVLLLLKDPPTTKKGSKIIYRKRIQMAASLIETYGISTFKNFVTSAVKDILDIKTLYTQGIIYKSIRNIPDCYDEKKLSRYNFYLERIGLEIPYTRILRLYCMLKESGKWYSSEDMLSFMYDYYGGVEDAVIS